MIAWWHTRTLRFRLALWYAVGGSLLLAAFSGALYWYVATTMARPLDHLLRRDLEEVRRRLQVDANRHLIWDGHPIEPDGVWDPEDPWFELWDTEGRLVGRFWPFNEKKIDQPPSAPTRGRETLSVFNITRDLRLRVLSVPFRRVDRDEVWMLRVLSVHQPKADALRALRWIIFITLPVVVALLVLGGYAITRRWLIPLDRMAEAAEAISAEDLNQRLPVVNPHDELGRLAGIFNFTLDRLSASFIALDQFVADASHELRTPLTTLRSVGEVGLRRSRSADEYREIIGSMLEEAQRLQSLVERLLELARAEGGPAARPTPTRLDFLVLDCVNELAVLAELRGQSVVTRLVDCTVAVDPVIFRQALQNIVDNALKYSPEGATILVTLREEYDAAVVAVTDQGPGISETQRRHFAERFYRPDESRGRQAGGFGLGLALTKAYLRLLGGKLDYSPADAEGSTFRLTIPKQVR